MSATKSYLTQFEDWLMRLQPFGIILSQTQSEEVDPKQMQSIHLLTAQWAKQYQSLITAHCQGIAIGVETVQERIARQTKTPQLIKTVFGCPGQIFLHSEEARQWIQQQLSLKT
ncbi:hypothetical protein [Acaryochloris marina]|uniref:STAS/SEC14 domain-containing protein n=1 Tax=Acaryochloris marina (strain MBIC 11017) TaxID=329726 RepID=A8ZKS2_ACAM1|nr:hypothetical protein [Acaryochloris marina]ABW31390.1 hypothetical protein AM1_A0272 [Acaryochloris marina MBIC11017]